MRQILILILVLLPIFTFGRRTDNVRLTTCFNNFSTALFEDVSNSVSMNVVSSPISAAFVLLMMALGARFATQREILSTLNINDPRNQLPNTTSIKSFVTSFNDFTGVELHVANSIFVADNFTVKAEFTNRIESCFGAEIKTLNFGDSNKAANIINRWCANQTKNQIENVITPGELNSDSALVLVNAVYFKGVWLRPFNSKFTTSQAFHIDRTVHKNVTMMYQKGRFEYGEKDDLGIKFVKLPYKSTTSNDKTYMYIVLPKESNDFKNVEEKIHKLNLRRLKVSRESDVHLHLPQFNITSTIDLKKHLENLKLKSIFERPDFRGISNDRKLRVTSIIQKVSIEVNEEGSEASASTVMTIQSRMFRPEYYMVVNRPFIVLITTTDSILFMAKVTDPTL